VIREVAEELGVTIALTGLSDVYSDPTHVLLDPDGTVHQQLALCFHAVPAPAHATEAPRPDGIETLEVAWGAPACSRPGYGQRNMPRAGTTP
jgi:8-oxo-dGTP pyrophosphatase MutT (NUDIX family)